MFLQLCTEGLSLEVLHDEVEVALVECSGIASHYMMVVAGLMDLVLSDEVG